MPRPVREFIGRNPCSESLQNRIVRDQTKADDGPQAAHGLYFPGEKRQAVFHLIACGFILRRNTAHRVGDPRRNQSQPVIRPRRIRPPREPEFKQRGIQKIPGVIPRERPPGKIRPAQPRRQPDDQKACVKGAERRNGCIMLVGKFRAVLGAEITKTRTKRAITPRNCSRTIGRISGDTELRGGDTNAGQSP